MEPFALFNLLKSLLLDGSSAPSQTDFAPHNVELSDSNKQPQEKANRSLPQGENRQENLNGTAANESTPQENYCLDFIRRHEERAGRRK